MDVTTETFEHDVVERSRELPVVVDFWAAWCGPYPSLGPAIEASREAGGQARARQDRRRRRAGLLRATDPEHPTVAVFRDGAGDGLCRRLPTGDDRQVPRRAARQGGRGGRGVTRSHHYWSSDCFSRASSSVSHPCQTMTGSIARAATGSAHHQPKAVLRPIPTRSASERYAHTQVSTASPGARDSRARALFAAWRRRAWA